jgi:hypothetical protein
VSLHELLREFPRLTGCDQQSTHIGVFVQEYPVGRYLAFEPPNTLRHEVILPYRIESIASSLERVERKTNIYSPTYMYILFFPNLDSRDLRLHCV